ncbi:TcfC E-set like domain-containing protein [Microbulbifer aggregans]|uniref:TcfC E-set like domain-containing protein n=1 Tax=Microbulbifer aggregans TaxID=1769779 RepID=UPI001CFE76C0|nr:TcfC E-set like domain-containing protein [Microbulbifer aggregans]
MNQTTARGILTLALMFSSWANNAAATAAFTLETTIPEGFADLAAPQQLVADVYFGNRAIGTAQVVVTPESVQFLDPDRVLEMLPQTLDPEVVLSQLSRPQQKNAHRVCYSRQQANCGVLLPETLGIIYDDSRFRVDVFLSPALLPQTEAIKNPFLPEASSRLSFVQNLTGSWSGVRNDTGQSLQNNALFGQSILSFGESGLHSQWAVDNLSGSQVYQLHWTRDYQGKSYSLGLIQPQNQYNNISSSPYFYGVEYRSSLNSRTDRVYQQGAQLEVNMPVRGRVELRKDDRLVHSEFIEAGNQLIDTSTLPGGAYTLDIRTLDENGRLITEYSHFFAKDAILPAPDEWQWSLQAGAPAQLSQDRVLPDSSETYLIQGALARRLLDNTGLFTGFAATESEQIFELGARWIGEHLEISPSALTTQDGRYGYRVYGSLQMPWMSLSASESFLEDDQTAEPLEYSLLNQGYLQRNAMLSAPLWNGQLSLRYQERSAPIYFDSQEFNLDTATTGARRLKTLQFRKNLFRSRYWQGDVLLAHNDADGEQLSTLTVQFRFQDGNWTHSTNARTDSGRSDDQNTRLGFQSRWRDGDRWVAEVNQDFAGEASADAYLLSSNTRIAGHRGQVTSSLNYRNTSRGNSTSKSLNYLGSFSTSIIANQSGAAWGGERALDSALLVNIDGSPDQDFEILVDGVRRGYAKGGERSVVNLSAFQSYDISVKPLGDGFFEYQDNQESVTLYPGNVADVDYAIRPLILVIGRLFRGGAPVVAKKISIGEYTATTDDFGVFQMEMFANPRTMRAPDVLWNGCRVPIPEQEAGDDWLNLGIIDLDRAVCEKEAAHVANR